MSTSKSDTGYNGSKLKLENSSQRLFNQPVDRIGTRSFGPNITLYYTVYASRAECQVLQQFNARFRINVFHAYGHSLVTETGKTIASASSRPLIDCSMSSMVTEGWLFPFVITITTWKKDSKILSKSTSSGWRELKIIELPKCAFCW